MTSIFISHSSKDKSAAVRLAKHLRKAGFKVWVDVDSIPDGSTWPREIEKAVKRCTAMVVVMSKNARDSEWVERETLLAMDLRKPLFIALVDDTPLPLHLINRQFTDFRPDQDTAAVHLVAVLKGLNDATPSPENLSPKPDEHNFFDYLEQFPGGKQNALIARDVYQWAKNSADVVKFGGKYTPGFHAVIKQGETEISVFSVWAYARQPALQVQFLTLSAHPPYDDQRMRLSTLRSFNRLLPSGQKWLEEKADRRPTLPLNVLRTAEKLEMLKEILSEIFDNVRAAE